LKTVMTLFKRYAHRFLIDTSYKAEKIILRLRGREFVMDNPTRIYSDGRSLIAGLEYC